MTRLSLRSASEVAALLSVLFGLVFVGVEIRNNTAVARAESRRELAEQNVDFLMEIALDDDVNDLWSQYWSLEWFEGLTPSDQTRAENVAIALILRLENVFLQHEAGFLDEASLPTYGMLQPKTREPWFVAAWHQVKPLRDPAFVLYFERVHDYAP